MKMQSSLLPQLQQKLKLSPQIIQSIEILQLPLLALVEHVQQELVDNPVLEEVLEEKKDENQKDDDGSTAASDDNTDNTDNTDKKDEFDKLGEMAEDWRDYYSQTTIRRSSSSEMSQLRRRCRLFSARLFMLDWISAPASLTPSLPFNAMTYSCCAVMRSGL